MVSGECHDLCKRPKSALSEKNNPHSKEHYYYKFTEIGIQFSTRIAERLEHRSLYGATKTKRWWITKRAAN